MNKPVSSLIAVATCSLFLSPPGRLFSQSLPPFVPVPPPQDSGAPSRPIRLEVVSSRRSAIIDVEDWWSANGLDTPFLPVPDAPSDTPGVLPPSVPARVGSGMAVTAGRDGDRLFVIYGEDFSKGSQVVLFRPDGSGGLSATHALDFSGWFGPEFRIWWAQLRDGVLYLSYGINGYASEVNGKTAYLAAVEMQSLKTVWRSDPLVSNSRNFAIVGDSILTGYGFTAEPDYLFVIDRATGRTAAKEKLASAPEFIVPKGDQLHVRCYNRDYVFRLLK